MKQWAATQTTPGVWVFTWTPTPGRVYEIWDTGVLVATTEPGAGSYTTGVMATDMPPAFEIHDTLDGDAQNKEYTPVALLQWRGVPGATGYNVYQQNPSWRVVDSIMENGFGWYMYNSAALVDRTLNKFRVTALDSRGVAGANVEFHVTMVCNPRPVRVVDITCLAGTLAVEVE